MVYVLRNALGEIVSLSDTPFVLNEGQMQDESAGGMAEWAAVFRIRADREMILAGGGDAAAITVEVNTQPAPVSIDLEVNETIQTVPLAGGIGGFEVDAAVPGIIVIRPADRATYCAAGEGMAAITAV